MKKNQTDNCFFNAKSTAKVMSGRANQKKKPEQIISKYFNFQLIYVKKKRKRKSSPWYYQVILLWCPGKIRWNISLIHPVGRWSWLRWFCHFLWPPLEILSTRVSSFFCSLTICSLFLVSKGYTHASWLSWRYGLRCYPPLNSKCTGFYSVVLRV